MNEDPREEGMRILAKHQDAIVHFNTFIKLADDYLNPYVHNAQQYLKICEVLNST